MSRVKGGIVTRRRHKKILKMAKGYRGRAKSCFRVAIERVEKGLQYAYRDRKNRKRDFRRLWIVRLNAAARIHGMSYSMFMNGLKKAEIEMDRKVLAWVAKNDDAAFGQLVEKAKAALAAEVKKAA